MAEKKKETAKKAVDKKSAKVDKDEAQKKARLKAERELFLQQTAETLMRENSVKEIWRDDESGYWFTNQEYADAHVKKHGSQLKLTKYTL